MNNFKHMVRVIVPKGLLDGARATIDQAGLAILPRRPLDSRNLRAMGTASLKDIFGNTKIGAAWENDNSNLKGVFGDGDKLGAVNPGDRRALYYLIMALAPQTVLEIGTHIAASTLYIACALKRLHQNGLITTIDITDVNNVVYGPWKLAGLTKSPRELSRELECLDQIDFHTGPCLRQMRRTKDRYDFIFLDGDHSARSVYQEISAALALLKVGGVILLHDYCPAGKPLYPEDSTIFGPFYALERIRTENQSINVLPLGSLPWRTKNGTNVTSLALVVRHPQ